MDGSSRVLSLTDLDTGHVALVGGKCANLGELIRAGLPVPPGFAMSTYAFDRFMAHDGLVRESDRLRASLDWADMAGVRRAAEELRERALRIPLPEDLTEEVIQAYWRLGALTGQEDPPVAVRSSAVAEDSPDLSFAGVQDSFLWRRGLPAVLDGIRRCFASYFNPQALTYRRRRGADAGGLSVAVQCMVDAWVGGVMFTLNPATGDPSTVAIEASWGLGTAVVNGDIIPDHFLYSKITGEMVRREIHFKTVEYVPAPGGGVHLRPVPPRRQNQACLSAEEVAELTRLARVVERHYGSHQDLEWAVARQRGSSSGIWLLQSRPETVWSRPTRPGDAEATDDTAQPQRHARTEPRPGERPDRDVAQPRPAGHNAVSRITGYLAGGRLPGAGSRG